MVIGTSSYQLIPLATLRNPQRLSWGLELNEDNVRVLYEKSIRRCRAANVANLSDKPAVLSGPLYRCSFDSAF
jgi:hypothetical protein